MEDKNIFSVTGVKGSMFIEFTSFTYTNKHSFHEGEIAKRAENEALIALQKIQGNIVRATNAISDLHVLEREAEKDLAATRAVFDFWKKRNCEAKDA